jgi:RHS repeat-associated protein
VAESPKFTGKERDPETGLDYFVARYFGAGLGRFLSPDPGSAGAHEAIPQTWNAYTYAGNNPLNAVDPDGLDYYLIGGDRCGHEVRCDDEGFVVDEAGNRVVITDEQVLSGEVQVSLGEDGVLSITTPQGTFTAVFFDPNPLTITVSPSFEELKLMTLETAGEMADLGVKTAMVMTAPAFIAAGGAGIALAGESASIISSVVFRPVTPSPRQVAYVTRILVQGGRKALEKAIRSWERLLADDIAKLDAASRAGGPTSSIESEIRNFQALIKAAKDLLGKTP